MSRPKIAAGFPFFVARVAALIGCALLAGTVRAESWFVSFPRTQVAPVMRSDTPRLIDVGTVDTDGFKEIVFSLAGEFKEALPTSGRVGVLLVPDNELALYLLRNEDYYVFPLEATYEVRPDQRSIFISPQQTARIAFPSYRVFLYNETASGAEVVLFLYRTR